jgi:hypothetical protein
MRPQPINGFDASAIMDYFPGIAGNTPIGNRAVRFMGFQGE